MSAHDIGVSVDEWMAAVDTVRDRIAFAVRALAKEGVECPGVMAGDIAAAIADLEAMQRLSEGPPVQRVEVVDKATD